MRRKTSSRSDSAFGTQALCCIRAALLACIATAALILVLAFLLRWDVVPLASVRFVNVLIKAASACFAGLLCVRSIERKAWLFGGFAGMLYILLAYIVFAMIEREFSFSWNAVSDLALGFACGMGTAVICRLLSDIRSQRE